MKAAAEPARAMSRRAITAQIARIAADYQGKDEPQPLLDYPPAGKAPSENYFGAVDALIDESLDRAKRTVKEHP
jgi:hypothetical protein